MYHLSEDDGRQSFLGKKQGDTTSVPQRVTPILVTPPSIHSKHVLISNSRYTVLAVGGFLQPRTSTRMKCTITLHYITLETLYGGLSKSNFEDHYGDAAK